MLADSPSLSRNRLFAPTVCQERWPSPSFLPKDNKNCPYLTHPDFCHKNYLDNRTCHLQSCPFLIWSAQFQERKHPLQCIVLEAEPSLLPCTASETPGHTEAFPLQVHGLGGTQLHAWNVKTMPTPQKPKGHALLARIIVIFLINWKALRQSWAPGLQTLPDLLQTTFQLLKATAKRLKWKKCPDSILLFAFQLFPCGHLYTAVKSWNALLSHQGCPAVLYGGDWCWQVCCTQLSYFVRSLSATFHKGWCELIQGPSQRRKESSFLAFYIQARSKNPHRVHPCHCLPTRSFPLSCCSVLAGEGACHPFCMCLRESQQSCSDAALMLLRCSTSAPEGTALSGAAERSEPRR